MGKKCLSISILEKMYFYYTVVQESVQASHIASCVLTMLVLYKTIHSKFRLYVFKKST